MASNTFAQRWSPALSLLVNPKDPTESIDFSNTGGDPRHNLATLMPPSNAISDKDWADLITGKPHPSQVAGEEIAPSGSNNTKSEDWADLVTGKPAPPKGSKPPESPPEPDISGGFGLIAKGWQKNPVATAAIGAPLAIGAAAPFAGLGAMAMSALPWWASVPLGGYGLGKIADLAGAPGTGDAINSLMDLVKQTGKVFVP